LYCLTVDALGANNIEVSSGPINVYPNPANGEFTVSIKSEELGITNDVEVYNMLGEKVYSQPLIPIVIGTNSSFLIDLSSQPNGIYLIKLNFCNQIQYSKIVISH